MHVVIVGLTVALLLVFVAQAMRAIGRPRSMAQRFGLPLANGVSGAFVRVYGSRNLAIAAAAAVMLALGDARGVAVVLSCAVPLTLFDMAVVGRPARPHVAALVLLAAAAASWWRLVA